MVTVGTQMIHDSIKGSNPKYELKWKQTEKLVIMEVYIGGLSYNEVKVSYDDTSFSLNIKDPKYTLELKLANPVVKNFCVYKCQPEYFEVKLKKDLTRTSKRNMTWSSLFKGGSPIDRAEEVANAESHSSKDESQTTSESTPLESRVFSKIKLKYSLKLRRLVYQLSFLSRVQQKEANIALNLIWRMKFCHKLHFSRFYPPN